MTGISISIASDTKQFTSGIKSGVLEPLDDVAESLQKLGNDGDKAGDQLVAALKEDQRQTQANAKAYRDMSETINRTTKSTNNQFELSTREQTKLRREAIKQIGDEAKQNAAQTFSSFDGSAQSFVAGIQGTLGGLVASMGPIGLGIGAVGALGVGAINGALQKAQQDTDEFKQHVADLAGQLLDAGNTGHRALGDIADDIKKLATETDPSVTNLRDLKNAATTLKVPLRDVVFAYEQGGSALADLVKKSKALQAAEQARYEASVKNDPNQAYSGLVDGAIYYEQQLGKVNDTLTLQQKALKDSEDAAKLAAQAGLSDYKLKADLLSQVDKAYDAAAGSVDDYVDAESGIFDTAKYIAAMQAREQALKDYQTTLASSDLSPEARSFLNSQGEDAAATLLQGYKNGTADQKAQLAAIWNEAGSTSSGAYTAGLKDGLPATVPGPKVVPQLDTTEVEKGLKKIQSGVYQVTIGGRVTGRPLL